MKIAIPIVISNYGFSRATVAQFYNSDGLVAKAAIDELRLGYNPSTLVFQGPLIEDEATNVLTYSHDFTNAAWIKSFSSSVTLDATVTAPDGTLGAYYWTAPTTNGRLFQLNPLTTEVMTLSVYVKRVPATGTFEMLGVGDGGGASFDLAAGTVLTGAGTIQSLPNGWYRCSVTGLKHTNHIFLSMSVASENVYVWGAQLEIGSVATSLISTTATAETRAADLEASAPPSLVFSNVTEEDAPVWNAVDPFTAGNKVVVLGDYHRVYEAVGSNTNIFPPTSPNEWIDQGATNRWRMFDMNVGSEKQTVSEDSNNIINTMLNFATVVNTITLLNLYASSVRIIMRDESGNTVYDYSKDLLSGIYESSWWSFFFGGRSRITTLSLTDLPPYSPSTIEMILEGGEDVAKIGKEIIGSAVDIGCTRYGTSVGIVDFSRKERDPFGNNYILQRRYVDRVDFDIQILTSRVDEIKKLLADIRATPVLYIGDDRFQSTVIYGFFRDFSIVISGPRRSDATLQIEGI